MLGQWRWSPILPQQCRRRVSHKVYTCTTDANHAQHCTMLSTDNGILDFTWLFGMMVLLVL
ncbi:MAG: hypothetical protein ACKPKO_41435, partial [Candidatus Fonsibacter sp.]